MRSKEVPEQAVETAKTLFTKGKAALECARLSKQEDDYRLAESYYQKGFVIYNRVPGDEITYNEVKTQQQEAFKILTKIRSARTFYERGKIALAVAREREQCEREEFEAQASDFYFSQSENSYEFGIRYYRDALNLFLTATQIWEYYPEAFNMLGKLYNQAKKTQEAYNSFAEAIRLKPDFAEAHCNLSLMKAALVTDAISVIAYEGALDSIETAIKYAPNCGYFYHVKATTLGVVRMTHASLIKDEAKKIEGLIAAHEEMLCIYRQATEKGYNSTLIEKETLQDLGELREALKNLAQKNMQNNDKLVSPRGNDKNDNTPRNSPDSSQTVTFSEGSTSISSQVVAPQVASSANLVTSSQSPAQNVPVNSTTPASYGLDLLATYGSLQAPLTVSSSAVRFPIINAAPNMSNANVSANTNANVNPNSGSKKRTAEKAGF